MIALAYTNHKNLEETRYRSCDRCGINMHLNTDSPRKQCDDCIYFDVLEFGRFDWLFGRAAA